MSLLFHTGNDSLPLEQLKSKRDANTSERLRLAQEFQRLEIAGGECRSVESFDRNDLIGKMIVAGLLEIDDTNTLAPADRLLLAQRRYLDEELSYLIETKSAKKWTPLRVIVHKSATYMKLVKDVTTTISLDGSGGQFLHGAMEVSQDSMEGEKEEGELSDSEEPTLNEVHNSTVSAAVPVAVSSVDTVSVPKVSVTTDSPDEKNILEPMPTKVEPPLSPTVLVSAPNQLTVKEVPTILVPAPTKTEVAWQYYHRLEKLTEEERTAAILEVRARHFNGDDKINLLHLMPKFDPTTDAGILITYGRLLPPNSMNISVANMKLIEAGRKLMGMDPEIPNRSKVSPKLLSSLTKSNLQMMVSEAEVKEVKQRYLLHHKGKKLVDLMPVFDPSTDLGKLIMWGEFIPPRAMQISTLHVNQIQQMRAIRGLHPILPYHQNSTNTTASAAVNLGAAGSSFASQLSCYQNANQYFVALHDLECAVLKLSDPEINAAERRFAKHSRGKTNFDMMPVFDPTCDLGKLILAGRRSLAKKVIVPPEHEKLLEESQAAVRLQRTRVQRLLQRVQELEPTVPVEQRVVIPPSWRALSSDAPLYTAPSYKTLAEHQEPPTGGNGLKKRKMDQSVSASYNSANKRATGSQSAQLCSEGATSARQEDYLFESNLSESEVNQSIEATSSRDPSIAEIRQEKEQVIPSGVCLATTLLQQEETRNIASAKMRVPARNDDSSNNSTAVLKEGEAEGSTMHSVALSDAEKIREEFERMKRMYEEFISQ